MKEAFVRRKFKEHQLDKIDIANSIVREYSRLGLKLTLRQLYYQFVAHHDLPNSEKSYKTLGVLISNARLAGLLDWAAIEDRGRVADTPNDWSSLDELMKAAVHQFRLPRREDQLYYVELWVEKQALAGVLEPVAQRNHVTLMVNKGYSSQSAMYEASKRFIAHEGQEPVLLYLGDHDPSGEDMVRDIGDRLRMFGVRGLSVEKIALTIDQVHEYDPPPNPTKMTDSRAEAYVEKFGDESWEVDALDPTTLVELIQEAIDRVTETDRIDAVLEEEQEQQREMREKLGWEDSDD
jgi:hypothetical protein